MACDHIQMFSDMFHSKISEAYHLYELYYYNIMIFYCNCFVIVKTVEIVFAFL